AGLPSSRTRSSTCCSSSVSTSARVETTCCASTARHTSPAKAAALDATARGVQVRDDTDHPFDRTQQVPGPGRQGQVVAGQPCTRRFLVPPECVQRPEHAYEQARQLPFLGVVR